MRNRVSRLVFGVVAVVAVLGVLGFLLGGEDGRPPTESSSVPASSAPESPAPTVSGHSEGDEDPASALAAARQLTVKGRAPKTGYSRDEFGQRWFDTDRNGCGQRDDILRRDLTDIVTKTGTDGCVVLSGTLVDPFTGRKINFLRGDKTSTAVQIDHAVALLDGWVKGAQPLDPETRREFANDFLNLIAVDGPSNAAKGAGDAATWLPPNKSYRCSYVARQVAVKQKYQLWVTEAEQDAMVRVLTGCPDEALPTTESVAAPDRDPSTDATAAPEPDDPRQGEESPRPSTEPEDPDEVHYANCDEVRAAGKDPIHTGEPGYGRHLDRDGDGVGCQ